MRMKLSKIALGVAGLCAAPATFALTPAQMDGATARLWLSGASAPTASVYKGVLTLCRGMTYKDALGVTHTNPGTRDAHLYLESSSAGRLPGAAGDRMAYTCTVGTDDGRAGSLEGKKVAVFHTVEGGSFNYVTPHISIAGEVNPNLPGSLRRTSNIENLGATGQCANGTAENVAVELSGLNNSVGVYRGCATTVQNFTANQSLRANVFQAPDRPEGGFSDTEYLINKLNLDVTTELGEIGSEVPTNIAQVFGVVVSYPLYYQLQKNDIADGRLAATCDDAPFTAVSPNLTLACQPDLAAQRYTTIANVDTIGGVDGSLFGAAATPPGTSGKVQLHRRAITSGTQSASNLRFLEKPCNTGLPQGALNPARAADSTARVAVTENSSTGGVKSGLTAATNAGEFGLGFVSMENIPVAGVDKWAFVKLDSASPNADAKQRVTAMDGIYTAWYELVAFTAHTAFTEGQDLIAAVNTSLGNPGITDLTGLFITPLAGVEAPNVGKGFRAGNSCQAPIQ
ncbi:MAG: hypothetical protein H0X43_08910 [Nitrosospira sp.]|nr:hypothetical protein [Nitrosospira sp.]